MSRIENIARFEIDNTDVRIIATLMGCEPAAGLVNTMNELRESGKIHRRMNYGQMKRAVLFHIIESDCEAAAEAAAA